MRTRSTDDHAALLADIEQEWLRQGLSTGPADRNRAEWAVRSAIEAAGHETHSMVFIWVDSPAAGVIASTYVGFALEDPMTGPITAMLEDALSANVPAARKVRRNVDVKIRGARSAVHKKVAAELAARGPEWEQWRNRVGNNAWNQVWETVGDPIYGQMFGDDAAAADGLFEDNLTGWADAMVDGQFNAGAMAQIDAMYLLDEIDPAPFEGLRRLAQNCTWWWPFGVGAVLCERPAAVSVQGKRVSMEFRDGWKAG